MKWAFLFVLALCALASAEIFHKEQFSDGNAWTKRWVQSDHKRSEAGDMKLTAGKWFGDEEKDKGIQTSQDARFYFYTSKMDKEFDNTGKDLVLQFSVKHEQKIDCGGGYLKLLSADTNQKKFNGDTDYEIMFGPDICGTSTRKVHVIFNYKGKNHLIKKDIPCETDQLTHVYTLIVRPDMTYEVRIDGVKKQSGSLVDDWDMLPARKIKDPNVSKPKDWVDDAMMDDPEDVKPATWDDTPKEIPDPDAQKPEDWDDEADGEWEAPTIPNPEYKGEWKPKKIKNPDYKGPWVHPEIDNPEFQEDPNLYVHKVGMVGIDLWQVKSGTIFDNILVSDSVEDAEDFLAATFSKSKDAEKRAFDDAEKARKAAEEEERKQAEEARKAAEQDDEDEDEDEESNDHDEL